MYLDGRRGHVFKNVFHAFSVPMYAKGRRMLLRQPRATFPGVCRGSYGGGCEGWGEIRVEGYKAEVEGEIQGWVRERYRGGQKQVYGCKTNK